MKQFSLRDLLFIIVIVSLLFGWWVDRRNRSPTTGRFQIQNVSGHAIILDTATGQVWDQAYENYRFQTSGFKDPKLDAEP